MKRANIYLTAVWLGLCLATIVAFTLIGRTNPTDFVPFYCAARIAAEHGQVYRALPLAACERDVAPNDFAHPTSPVIPAPLPPYVIVLYRFVAMLPYDVAVDVWRAALICAAVASVVLMRRLTELPLAVILAALAPLVLRDTLPLGQPIPVVVIALVAAGVALNAGRDAIAGAAVACSMLEPHIGLPACLAVFLFRRESRPALLVAGSIAAGVSLMLLPLTSEYFTRVLPAQAGSEVAWFQQYSLTHVLWSFGTAPALAVRFGEASYVAMLVASIGLARMLVKHGWQPAMLALVPPAACMLGGTYVHVWHIGAAIPAALVMANQFRADDRRHVAALVVLALAIPWIEIGFPFTALLGVFAAATIAYLCGHRHPAALTLAILIVAVAGVLVAPVQPRMQPLIAPLQAYPRDALAQVPWSLYVAATNPSSPERAIALVLQIPTWAGLIGLLTLLWLSIRREPGKSRKLTRPALPSRSST